MEFEDLDCGIVESITLLQFYLSKRNEYFVEHIVA